MDLTNELAARALSILARKPKFNPSCKKANKVVIPSRLNNKQKPKAYPHHKRAIEQYAPQSWMRKPRKEQLRYNQYENLYNHLSH